MGYFADLGIETDMQPGPSDGTATVKFVDVGQADMGFPSPGVFSFALENGMKLKSAFHMGALDTFSLRLPQGRRHQRPEDPRGQDHPARLCRLAVDRRSDAGRAGRRYHQGQVRRGRLADLGHRARRPARATRRSAGKGLRAEWIGTGLEFEYWLGVQKSPLFANTFVVRAADLEDPDKKAFLDKYLRGWAMGLEFGYQNPRAAVEAVFEQFPTLASNIGPELGTTSILQQINVVPRRHVPSARAGATTTWPPGRPSSTRSMSSKQITKPVKAEDVCTNDCIAAANNFDHAKVKADADGYKLQRCVRRDRRRERQGAPLRPGRAGLIRRRNNAGGARAARLTTTMDWEGRDGR